MRRTSKTFCEQTCEGCKIAELSTPESQENARRLIEKVTGGYHSNQIFDALGIQYPGNRNAGLKGMVERANQQFGPDVNASEVEIAASAQAISRIITDNCVTQPQ